MLNLLFLIFGVQIGLIISGIIIILAQDDKKDDE